jgi:hypothetical protein
VPVGVTGHRTQRPRGQVGPRPPARTTLSPTQLLTEPRGRTAANTAASGPSDRAAGPGSQPELGTNTAFGRKHAPKF